MFIRSRRLGTSAATLFAMGLVAACVGGGGTTSANGGTGGDLQAQCQEFVALTAECYRRAGRESNTNAAICGSAALDANTVAQIECTLASREAYCSALVAAMTRDAGALVSIATNPEVIKLNACTAARTMASPCKEAVLALADCGAGTGYDPACGEPSRSMAQCVVDNVQGACAFYKPRTGAATITPETQKYQDCQLAAIRAGRDASSP